MSEPKFNNEWPNHNKTNILNSTECACIDCFHVFKPEDITYFIRERNNDDTAVCPYCLNDTIIPNNLVSYTIDDLKRFHKAYLHTEFDETITEFKHMVKKDIDQSNYYMNAKSFMGANKVMIDKSVNASCVYCIKTFPVNEVINYVSGTTALCPYCNKKTVIPDCFVKYTVDELTKFHNIKYVN